MNTKTLLLGAASLALASAANAAHFQGYYVSMEAGASFIDDSSVDNDIVRTNDTVTYNLGIRYEGDEQTKPTTRFTLPRGQSLVSLPPYCLAGSSVTPASLPEPEVPLTARS